MNPLLTQRAKPSNRVSFTAEFPNMNPEQAEELKLATGNTLERKRRGDDGLTDDMLKAPARRTLQNVLDFVV